MVNEICVVSSPFLPCFLFVCVQDMAMLSSATACAPITAHNAIGSVTNLAFSGADGATSPVATASSGSEGHRPIHFHGLAERLHGLTERLGSLGNSRSMESDVSNRTRTGTAGCPDT